MLNRGLSIFWSAGLALILLPGASSATEKFFVFQEVGEEAGILPPAAAIKGHAAAWGDADGDGWIDLYVGTYHDKGSKTNLLFRNTGDGKFNLDEQETLRLSSHTSAAIFEDFNNNGDLDLYVSNNVHGTKQKVAVNTNIPCRNEGVGRFTDVSPSSGLSPVSFKGRGVANSPPSMRLKNLAVTAKSCPKRALISSPSWRRE